MPIYKRHIYTNATHILNPYIILAITPRYRNVGYQKRTTSSTSIIYLMRERKIPKPIN